MLYLSAVLTGMGIPISTIGITVWCGDFSSEEAYAHRLKICQTAFTLGSPPLPGTLADATGSYRPAYLLFGIMIISVFITIQTIYRRHLHPSPRHVDQPPQWNSFQQKQDPPDHESH